MFSNASAFRLEDRGMIPFMAVTGAPTESEARAKVAAIQADGANSFLLYARSGLQIEYMGDAWLNLAEWFCDEAARRGLKVWLYDEYNWPSGTCKGRVPAENEAWRYREAGVFPRPDGGWFWEETLAPAGWVNVCEPEAVRRFIELTHEAYARRLARFFADGTILGFFTDEPGHPVRVTYRNGTPAAAFRLWSGLKDEYRAETGRDFRSDAEVWLDSLQPHSERGAPEEPGEVLRTDAESRPSHDFPAIYARLLGRRFRTSYFDQIRVWCDAHGVALTGHMIDENSLANSCRFNGDPMLCLRGESVPGIDEIGSAFDPDGKASPCVEWLTFGMARQAIVHNGHGGAAELFACGPADLPPAALRHMVWMCAFHGIDRYVTCMDVMDERGLVEKHNYLSAAGPVHPWYAHHARLFADECRRAAAFAAKRVSEREVGVRYPDRAAADIAFLVNPGAGIWNAKSAPDINGLLRALETHQFTCRLIPEEEDPCDLPLIFTCRADGTFDEEKTGAAGIDAAGAVALCRRALPASFRVFEADGETEADELMVRTCEDGTSAVVNMRAFATRRLVVARGDKRAVFVLSPHGIRIFAPGALPPDEVSDTETRSLVGATWTLRRDRPNLLRVVFPENGGRQGAVTFAAEVETRPILRECAISYAVTASGRPIGNGEEAPVGEKVIRHDAAPYAFAADGAPLAPATGKEAHGTPAANAALPGVFAPLYRAAAPRLFAPGPHTFEIVSGEPDVNYFLPALWLSGDFRVFGQVVVAEAEAPVGFGSFAALGYPHYAGALTWRTTVAVPAGVGWRLQADTGGAVASARLCGVELGARAWEPFAWEVPDDLAGQTGELEITVFSSAQPMFGPYGATNAWDMRLWYGEHAPGAACGLFAAAWARG